MQRERGRGGQVIIQGRQNKGHSIQPMGSHKNQLSTQGCPSGSRWEVSFQRLHIIGWGGHCVATSVGLLAPVGAPHRGTECNGMLLDRWRVGSSYLQRGLGVRFVGECGAPIAGGSSRRWALTVLLAHYMQSPPVAHGSSWILGAGCSGMEPA